VKVVLAGLGSIGRRHLRNLLTLGERDIILYRTKKSTLPDDELSAFPVETNLNTILDNRPDAVIIANPTALHLDIAIPSAEAGCSLLIEKPVSHNMERINELKNAVQRGGGQVLIGFQFRFHPCIQKIAQILNEGSIGRPLSAYAHYGDYLPDWHPWEDYRKSYSANAALGGGVTLTLCHPLDYMCWLLGEVESLSASTSKISDLDIQVEDVAQITLHFAQGTIGSIHLNYYQQPPSHLLEIIGTHGTVRWDHTDNTVKLYSAHEGAWKSFPAPGGFERNEMFLSEMRHFLQVVRGEVRPICTLSDGIHSLKLAIAVNQFSDLKSGRKIERRPLPQDVELVVFDFDGVFTDNRVWVDEKGHEQVAVNRSDGLGIAMLRQEVNTDIFVLSTETNPVVSARCKKLKIPFVQGVNDKVAMLKQILAKKQVKQDKVIYVGNDVNDLPCFQLVACAVVPADAHPDVMCHADLVLKNRGGHGAVREVCNLLIDRG
jgi:YrbI family 3-deoxy-D-manno-octulosonate 8-phosphate phosphatase